VVSSSANYAFTLNTNRILVANFTANPVSYTVSLSASRNARGTVSGGGTFTAVVSRIFRTFGWLSGARPWLTR
jgi:hypothetical protein